MAHLVRTKRGVAAGLAAILLLSLANAPARAGDKTGIATLLGAAGGAVAGAQFGKGRGQLAAVAVGTLLGAALGNGVGRSLDRADQYAVVQAHEQALNAPIGETIEWQTPTGGYTGAVQTVRDGVSSSGAYCREYQSTVTIGGQVQQGYGTACLQPDGAWQIVRPPVVEPALPAAPTYGYAPPPAVVYQPAPVVVERPVYPTYVVRIGPRHYWRQPYHPHYRGHGRYWH